MEGIIMKRKLKLIAFLVFSLVAYLIIFSFKDKVLYPFADIEGSEIRWIAAEYGQSLLYKLSNEEQKMLLDALQNVMILKEDRKDEHLKYTGARRNIHFILRFTNGETVSIACASLFFIIDGKWYFADRDSTSKVDEIYYSLVGFC